MLFNSNSILFGNAFLVVDTLDRFRGREERQRYSCEQD
jgi:hypothetical protein